MADPSPDLVLEYRMLSSADIGPVVSVTRRPNGRLIQPENPVPVGPRPPRKRLLKRPAGQAFSCLLWISDSSRMDP